MAMKLIAFIPILAVILPWTMITMRSVEKSGARTMTTIRSVEKSGALPGVTAHHANELQKWAITFDVALMVRLSTDATVKLIENGKYATKSVDIHDKSSDWGPMSGFVPVDAFFSKNKKVGEPHPLESTHPVHDSSGEPTGWGIVTLAIDGGLKDEFESNCLKPAVSRCPEQYTSEQQCTKPGQDRNIRFCLIHEPADDMYGVYYLRDQDVDPHPLTVHAYYGRPVTGDYDLWMVAPRKPGPLFPGTTESFFHIRTKRSSRWKVSDE